MVFQGQKGKCKHSTFISSILFICVISCYCFFFPLLVAEDALYFASLKAKKIREKKYRVSWQSTPKHPPKIWQMETPQYIMINVLLTAQKESHQTSRKKILELQGVWNEPTQTVQQYGQEKRIP